MTVEKEKNILDYLKKIAPGTNIRVALQDILNSNLGALIILDSPELYNQNMIEGGFKINTRFTPQRLFELSKMDGAIIISSDFSKILYANVLIAPDTTIQTNETGTRHKAAERCAKQSNTLAITISERRHKVTLYLNNSKYHLKESSELLRDLSTNLQVLEKQRELYTGLLNKLNILEVSNMVSAIDVCKFIQRAEMIMRISETLKRQFIEAGKEANVINLRYKELIKGVEKREVSIIRDYAILTQQRTKRILKNFTFDGLLDMDSISRLILEKDTKESIYPRGYRFLSHLNLSEKEMTEIIKQFGNINEIINAEEDEFDTIIKSKSKNLKKEILILVDQVLSEKISL